MVLPLTSALSPLFVALVAALRADVGLQTHLYAPGVPDPVGDPAGRIYDEGAVPAELVGRWVALGEPGESWAHTFMRPGSTLSLVVHLWHTPVAGDDVGKAVSLDTWAQVARVLGAPLTLGGHIMLVGVPVLVGIAKDTDGQSWHGIVQYDARTQVGP